MVCGDRQNVQRELAASTCVERQIRMPEIPDKVVFDRQITFVYRRHERQLVHVLEHLTWRIVSDGTEPVAIREAIDARPVLPFCNVPDCELEFVAGNEVYTRRRSEAAGGICRDLRAYKASLQGGIGSPSAPLKRTDPTKMKASKYKVQ